MAINLFISFTERDREQLESFRALAKNPQHELKFRDRSGSRDYQQLPVSE